MIELVYAFSKYKDDDVQSRIISVLIHPVTTFYFDHLAFVQLLRFFNKQNLSVFQNCFGTPIQILVVLRLIKSPSSSVCLGVRK